jgi:amino acid adenylation domain-containing protein
MTELSSRISALSPEQRALLAARLQSSGLGNLEPVKAVRRAHVDPAPLSFAQQRLWFLDRLEPGSAAYNIPFAARLKGSLDVDALQRALQSVVARHESLRTTFAEVNGDPVQIAAESSTVSLLLTDLSQLPEPEHELRRIASSESRAPFDLENGPLLRGQLLRLGPQEHVLLLTVHHIVSDGWSMGVLLRELGVLYHAAVTGQRSPLPDLPLQYADFALWQRKQLQSDKLERQLAYWKQRLAGAPTVLDLRAERAPAGVSTGQAINLTLALPKDLTDDLRALSRREGVTLFMTLLAAFKILLARYSGQEDIVVGTPMAGRTHTEFEGLIGCFLNTLVLRTDLSGEPTFRELVTRVRETALGAYAHQDLPFERLVEELQPARSLIQNPIFQVLFQAGDTQAVSTPGGTLRLDGIEVSRARTGGIGAKFDLSLRVRERPGGLSCSCTGKALSPETLAHLLDQFVGLLKQIVLSPESPIGAYSLVTDRSRQSLPDPRMVLSEPISPLVVEAIRRVAAEAPSQMAIEQGEHHWTYGELIGSVNAIAQSLSAARDPLDGVTAVTGHPSFGLVAAMLAVLSAGRVMLPIAVDLPEHRKRLMLRESKASLLLKIGDLDTTWADSLNPDTVVAICANTGRVQDSAANLQHAALVPGAAPRSDDPAYIFFTSGTTGTPKGVLGTHKGLSHFLAWQSWTFAVAAGDRCAQLTNISFDVMLRDILMPLWSGATLCLPPTELPPDQVLAWLATHRITVVHAVPSLASAWLAQAAPGVSLPALRWTFFAGEPLTDALVLGWRRVAPRESGVVNLYGPTETTLAKCYYEVPDGALLPGIQPVGNSLPGSQALVLAAHDRLCGVNELGEIVVRTPFRTRGYINAAEAQRRQFQVNPFGTDPDDLLYRTGDLGRYRPDGSVMVLARLDQQVKIRGVRIEPEEIAAVLSWHSDVTACAVVPMADQADDVMLVAYVVASRDPMDLAELRAFLAERLPAVMVPSRFVFIDRLPVTPNGKLDRRALPAPPQRGAAADSLYVAPRTPVESLLAGMWAEVLRVPRVGVHDDFFELGGHSLKATQIIARARAAFGIELPLRSLFETPTVAGLSLTISQRMIEAAGIEV